MQRIQVLPDILASQVAAGEVVERPASVVKELVDNSLDAGARRIEVLVRRGGASLLRVVDDGSGMDREDAVLSLERHATSKIRTKEDLGAIRTLGFRGEALPSIASVSKFTLTTRLAGALTGTCVSVEGGKLLTVEDSGCAPGTQVEVRQLFFNVPARKKFLRSEATEFSHIEQHLRVQAVAHPEVSFSLTHNDRLVFHLPGGSGLLERIRGLAGQEIAERLLDVPAQTTGGVAASGFIGEPGLTRSTRSFFLTFLNGRPVESPVFTYALRAAYGDALPKGQSPVAFLFVTIDPGEVDVNVHPAKREVRFRDGLGVQAALTVILGEALRRGRHATMTSGVAILPGPSIAPAEPDFSAAAPAATPKTSWIAPVRQQELLPAAEQVALRRDWADLSPPEPRPTAPPPRADLSGRDDADGAARPAAAPVPQPAAGESGSKTPAPSRQERPPAADASARCPYRILGLLADEYAVMEGEDGLVLMDFRAAWERVLFEDARSAGASGGGASAAAAAESQRLLVPLTLQLAPRDFDFVRGQLDALRGLGLGVEEFGPNTLKIDTLPAAMAGASDPLRLAGELLEELRTAGDRAATRRLDWETVAAAVSHQAARIRRPGAPAELDLLVRRLLACEMPYCSPSGRATLIQISLQELARKFGKR